MDQGSFSLAVIERWMDEIEDAPKHMALFSADPWAVADPTTVEVIGGTYARQDSLWLRSDVRAITLDAGVVWRSLVPGTVVAAVGAFDDPFAGELLFRSMLLDEDGNPQPRAYPSGGTHTLAAGQYVVGIDVPLA
jgi:hypothetical protein